MADKSHDFAPKSGVFEGKTSPGPKGSSHGVTQKMHTPAQGGANQSFMAGPNDGNTIVSTGNVKAGKGK